MTKSPERSMVFISELLYKMAAGCWGDQLKNQVMFFSSSVVWMNHCIFPLPYKQFPQIRPRINGQCCKGSMKKWPNKLIAANYKKHAMSRGNKLVNYSKKRLVLPNSRCRTAIPVKDLHGTPLLDRQFV